MRQTLKVQRDVHRDAKAIPNNQCGIFADPNTKTQTPLKGCVGQSLPVAQLPRPRGIAVELTAFCLSIPLVVGNFTPTTTIPEPKTAGNISCF